ncbi:peptidase family C54-domain-containing protein, partial [Amylostereum chailletii]
TDVYAASHPPHHPLQRKYTSWGGRAVLVLISVRLGLDGVNPIYYDMIKALYTFPQLLGIAVRQPLPFLDPHHTRPAVPLHPPPSAERDRSEHQTTPERPMASAHHRSPTSPASSRTASSTFSYHAPTSPSSLAHQLSTSSSSSGAHVRWRSTSPRSPGSDFSSDMRIESDLDPLQEHFVTAYSPTELRTFHCDRVRKLPLSGLDPSMLIAFLCKDQNDCKDLRRRIAEGCPHSPSTSPDMDGSSSSRRGEAKSVPSEVDTEEDPIGPLTPGPASRSMFESDRSALGQDRAKGAPMHENSMDADDEDWVDPSAPTPRETSAPPMAKSASNQSSASEDGGKKKRKKRERSAKDVPTVKAPSPPPSSIQHPSPRQRIFDIRSRHFSTPPTACS